MSEHLPCTTSSWLKAVSYTHLDVYKRQALQRVGTLAQYAVQALAKLGRLDLACIGGAHRGDGVGIAPVAYTHRYNRTGKDGESATVIINRSLRNSHRVTIPALDECASDVISGHECEIHNGTVTLDLYPLGSSIIYHHAEQRLQEPLDHGAGVVCHITSVPTDDGKPGTIGAPTRRFICLLYTSRCV